LHGCVHTCACHAEEQQRHVETLSYGVLLA
jgi:hypothetical protein